MADMLKGVCIIVIIVCVTVMIYTIINAINTAKRNKATDEATRRIFLAKIQQSQNTTDFNQQPTVAQNVLKQPFSFEAEKPHALNYDEFENDAETLVDNDKGLKDFFKK